MKMFINKKKINFINIINNVSLQNAYNHFFGPKCLASKCLYLKCLQILM